MKRVERDGERQEGNCQALQKPGAPETSNEASQVVPTERDSPATWWEGGRGSGRKDHLVQKEARRELGGV